LDEVAGGDEPEQAREVASSGHRHEAVAKARENGRPGGRWGLSDGGARDAHHDHRRSQVRGGGDDEDERGVSTAT
jgi:hypothetical protein